MQTMMDHKVLTSMTETFSTSNILQMHSINSLLEQNEVLLENFDYDTMSISEMFGLNSPRGLLDFGNSWTNGLSTSPVNNPYLQFSNFDEASHSPSPLNYTPVKNNNKLPLNISMRQDYFSASSPGSDFCGNNSPIGLMSSASSLSSFSNSSVKKPIFNYVCSRSNSPESDSTLINSNNMGESFSDLLNSLTLNETSGRRSRKNVILNLQNPNGLETNSIMDKWSYNNCPNSPMTVSSSSSVPEDVQLDRVAHFHRSAASISDATCTWSGVLPIRTPKSSGYSCKVFLGGVPWDISEEALIETFKPYGTVRVEWPGKESSDSQPKGYLYIIFESDKNVRALLQACTSDSINTGNYYFKISSKRIKAKEVQVIPWLLSDANCTKSTTQKLDPTKTVFVGALHGLLTAEGLAKIMNDLFDGVVYTGLDTDRHKYPIGSGRVTFNNRRSYMRAIGAAFIEIKTAKFSKKVQIDPYLEDSLCSICGVQQGPYFCRDVLCFRYFCRTCWQWQHNYRLHHHKPLMRNSKNGTVLRITHQSI